MGFQQPYVPIVKKKGFNPNPVAGNIPMHANGKLNPKVIGTRLYEEFWDEQFYRCINGYETGGIFIPGRYYFYLNFQLLNGVLGPMYPMYVDLDLEYFRLIDWVKERKKLGIVTPKARRKGLSEDASAILSHGLRFIEGYRGAVTAGIETYTFGLKNKFSFAQSHFIDEMRLNVLVDNDKTYHVGYERKDPIGGFVDDGYGGRLSFETMYDKATKLEGEYFHDVICEESGHNKLLGEIVSSIKPALQFGDENIGTFYIYGSGGNILSNSKAFKEFWDQAENFGLERFWVPGNRKHYPFYGNHINEYYTDKDTGEKIDAIPNLRHLKPYERIGCEDIEAAKAQILSKRVFLSKLPNKKRLKEHNQALPLTIEEAFTSGGSNNFDDEKLYSQLFNIEGNESNYIPVILEFVHEVDADGIRKRKQPLQVEHRPAKKNDPSGEIVWVYQYPRIDMKDLDIGGIDGYNQDQTQSGKSLGAMAVVRQGNKVNLINEGIHSGEYPVCLYYQRPARKEIFFDTCLKISVWYNLVKNTMCSAEQDFVIDYFLKNGGNKFLSPRPRSFDSPNNEQSHNIGAKMTSHSKPMILGIVQSMIIDYVQYWMFPELLRDCLAYDEQYIGTDWDSVDAIALAKMRIEDMKSRPRKNNEEVDDVGDSPEWIFDEKGNAILKDVPEKTRKKQTKKELPESVGGWRAGYTYDEKIYDDNDFYKNKTL